MCNFSKESNILEINLISINSSPNNRKKQYKDKRGKNLPYNISISNLTTATTPSPLQQNVILPHQCCQLAHFIKNNQNIMIFSS